MKLTPAKVTMLMLVAVGGLIGLYVIKGLFAVEKKVERPRIVNIALTTAYLAPGTKISDTHIGIGATRHGRRAFISDGEEIDVFPRQFGLILRHSGFHRGARFLFPAKEFLQELNHQASLYSRDCISTRRLTVRPKTPACSVPE